jgi:hypothetical protein
MRLKIRNARKASATILAFKSFDSRVLGYTFLKKNKKNKLFFEYFIGCQTH